MRFLNSGKSRFALLWTLTATLLCAIIAGVAIFATDFSGKAYAETAAARSAQTLAEEWRTAVTSSTTDNPSTFVLTEDWIAQPDAKFTTSFGSGAGFSDGRLYVTSNQNVILDLNGFKIDRDLADKDAVVNGSVILVTSGRLTIIDSSTGKTGLITGGNNLNTVSKNFNYGGGILAEGSGRLVMEGGTVAGNTAYIGAGICVSNANFEMKGGKVENNTAKDLVGDRVGGNGGGVAYMAAYITSGFTISGGDITGNFADGDGGGVYVASEKAFNENFPSHFEMTGGNVANNTAGANGGGIFFKACEELNANFNLANGVITGNTAIANGGGVYVTDNANFKITASTVNGNNAANGGGLYVTNNVEFVISDVTVDGNTATANYGGMYAKLKSDLTLSGCSFNGNTATAGKVGGLYINGNDHNLILTDVTVNGNSAGTDYGGMHFEKANVELNGSSSKAVTVQDNTAGKSAGGMFVDYSNSTFGLKGLIKITGNKANGLNSNFMLPKDQIIELTGDIEEGTFIYVSVENPLPYIITDGYTSYGGGKIPKDVFASDLGKGVILINGEVQVSNLTVLYKKPTLVKDTLSYTGETQTVELVDFDSDGMTAEGLTGKNVGSYTVTIKLKEGYIWYDSTFDDVILPWQIIRAVLSEADEPSLSQDFLIYSVFEQEVTIQPMNHIDVVGITPAGYLRVLGTKVLVPAKTPVGDYTITVKPAYGYIWADSDPNEEEVLPKTLILSIKEYNLVENWNHTIESSLNAGKEYRFILTEDWTAETTGSTTSFGTGVGFDGGRLYIPKGAEIILDLDGCTINRNLTVATIKGQVFYIEGKLTIIDSKGKFALSDGGEERAGVITGGFNGTYEHGGGVYVDNGGTFVFSGGIIMNNQARDCAGGVFVNNGATFIMNEGALISGNTAGVNGGGVYVTNQNSRFELNGGTISDNVAGVWGGGIFVDRGTFTMGGVVTVMENTANGTVDNLYLNTGMVIEVTASLTGSKLGVNAADKPCVFTKNYAKFNSVSPMQFFIPNNAYTIAFVGGEAHISGRTIIRRPTVQESVFFYNRTEHKLVFEGLDDRYMTVTGTTFATDSCGDEPYVAYVVIKDKEAYMWEDGTDTDMRIAWRIEKINYNMSGVRWDYNNSNPFVYDGTNKSIVLSVRNLPLGVRIKGYKNNSATNAGEYTASVEFEYDDLINHNAPKVDDCVWVIKQAIPVATANPIEGKYFEGGKVSSVAIDGTSSIEGVFTWTDGDDRIGGASKVYSWTFIPNDSNYASVTGTISLSEENIIPLWQVIVIPCAVAVGIILIVLIIVAVRRKRSPKFVEYDDDSFDEYADSEF